MQSSVETFVYCLFICQLGSEIAIQECPTLKGQSDHILCCHVSKHIQRSPQPS